MNVTGTGVLASLPFQDAPASHKEVLPVSLESKVEENLVTHLQATALNMLLVCAPSGCGLSIPSGHQEPCKNAPQGTIFRKRSLLFIK